MNILYDLSEAVIKNGDHSAIGQILETELENNQALSSLFDLPSNIGYLLKRLIQGCMATDPVIKANSAQGLQKFRQLYTEPITETKLIEFVFSCSNYKKGNHKKNEVEAYVLGRVRVFKALVDVVKNNSNLFKEIKEMMVEFPNLEEPIIELLYLLSNSKLLKMKFMDLNPKTSAAKFLYKILLHQKWSTEPNVTVTEGIEVISEQIDKFPEQNLGIEYFGVFLASITDSPAQFFHQYSSKFLDDTQEVDIHEIYYILIVLKGFLRAVKISRDNYQQYFEKGIIAVWLEQLRVLNKKMKVLAKQINISFDEEDQELAYDILVNLHQSDIYLDNISVNHPLASIYQTVDIKKYWQYVYNLCQEQFKEHKLKRKGEGEEEPENERQMQEQRQQQEEVKFTNFNELSFLVQHYHKQLSQQQIAASLVLYLNLYHNILTSKNNPTQQSKPTLFTITNIINQLFAGSAKRKNKKIKTRVLSILMKLDWKLLTEVDQQTRSSLKKCVVWVKKSVTKDKKIRTDLSGIETTFYNFYLALICFNLIYPEEIETSEQLQMVHDDLQKLSANQTKTKKKQKTNPQQKKPIHVLVDIFISLMTKPPKFLRKSMHELYEGLIPLLDETDLGSLITVITTPDANFIQEM